MNRTLELHLHSAVIGRILDFKRSHVWFLWEMDPLEEFTYRNNKKRGRTTGIMVIENPLCLMIFFFLDIYPLVICGMIEFLLLTDNENKK